MIQYVTEVHCIQSKPRITGTLNHLLLFWAAGKEEKGNRGDQKKKERGKPKDRNTAGEKQTTNNG